MADTFTAEEAQSVAAGLAVEAEPQRASGGSSVPVVTTDSSGRPNGMMVIPRGQVSQYSKLGAQPTSWDHWQAYKQAESEDKVRQQAAEAEAQQYENDPAAMAAAFGFNTLNTATFGGLAQAYRKFDPEQLETLQKAAQYNPTAAGIGTITGIAAPLLASGGASAAGGARATVGGLEAGAEAVNVGRGINAASNVAKVLTAAPVAVSRGAQAAARALMPFEGAVGAIGRAGIASGLEGAAYGAGDVISESAIQNHELTAENLWSGMWRGAAFGSALGVGLGATGEAAKHLLPRLPEVVNGALGRRALEAGEAEGGRGAGTIKDFSDMQTLRAIGGTPRDLGGQGVTQAMRDAKVSQIADALHEVKLEDGSPVFLPGRTAQEMAPRIEQAVRETTDKLDAIRVKVGEAAKGRIDLAPDIRGMVTRAREALSESLGSFSPEARRLGERAMSNLEDIHVASLKSLAFEGDNAAARELEAMGHGVPSTKPREITIKDLTDLRKSVDKIAFPKGKLIAAPEHQAELKTLRSVMENEIERATDRVSVDVGKNLGEEYRAAKKPVAALLSANKIASRAGAQAAGPAFTLKDIGLGMIGGAVTGHIGGPLVAGLGGKLLRTRGASLAASASRHVIGMIERRAAAEAGTLRRGASALIHEAPSGIIPETRHQYDKIASAIKSSSMTPDAAVEHASKMVGDLPLHAPNISGILAGKIGASIMFLRSKLPASETAAPTNPLQPHLSQPVTTDEEKDKFMRYVRGMTPANVITDLHHGKATSEEIETMRTVYPETMKAIGDQIKKEALKTDKPIPLDVRNRIAPFVGQAPMDPKVVAVLQSGYQKAQQPPGQMAGPPRKQVDLSKGMGTTSQQIDRRFQQ